MKKYTVVEAINIGSLEDSVDVYLKQGYCLVGGICVNNHDTGPTCFYQALCLPNIEIE